MMNNFRDTTAQARRLSMHVMYGGTLSQRDIDYCVEAMEQKDEIIQHLLQEVEFWKENCLVYHTFGEWTLEHKNAMNNINKKLEGK